MRILCMPYTHTFSHLIRPLAVAAKLRAMGHEVLFSGESSKTSYLERQNFEVLPLAEPNPEEIYGNIRAGKLRFIQEEELNRLIEADLELYKHAKPDLILADGRFSSAISAQIAGILHAAVVNVSSTEYRAVPYVPFFDKIPAPDGSAVRKLLDRTNLALEMLVFDNVMAAFSKLSRRHQLRQKVTATNCLAGVDLTLMPDTPQYFPTRNLPANYRYVGPLNWKMDTPTPEWWPPNDEGRPLLYLTMGTTGTPELFKAVYEALVGEPYHIVATTGGQLEGFPPAENFQHADYIDGDLVLERSKMVICHGGNGTIMQALGQGVPVLGMPTIPDQAYNMRRVSALGLGLSVDEKEAVRRPERIREAVGELLQTPDYGKNCLAFKDSLDGYDPPRQAAEAVLQMVESRT
jgi:MGT family glycosyltransferase